MNILASLWKLLRVEEKGSERKKTKKIFEKEKYAGRRNKKKKNK